jgi:hypothetical protein
MTFCKANILGTTPIAFPNNTRNNSPIYRRAATPLILYNNPNYSVIPKVTIYYIVKLIRYIYNAHHLSADHSFLYL